MKRSTLETLEPLLDVLRDHRVLDEVRPAAFHLDGRDFIHFHETAHGVAADVLLSKGRVRMPVDDDVQQAELLERIERHLISLEAHRERGRQR